MGGQTIPADGEEIAETMKNFKTFRIHIPESSLMKYDGPVWERFMEFVQTHRALEMEGIVWKDPARGGWILTGSASSRFVSLLLAAALGDDLTPILDKYQAIESNGAA